MYRGDVVAVQAGALTARDVAEAQTDFGVDLLHTLCGQAVAASGRVAQRIVSFDRPFLLTDTGTRSPLFAAVVRDPTA